MDKLDKDCNKHSGHIYDVDGNVYKITNISFTDNEITFSSINGDVHITRKLVKL